MREYVLLTPEGKLFSKTTVMRYFKIAKAIAGITRRFRGFTTKGIRSSAFSQRTASMPSRPPTFAATPTRERRNSTRDRAPRRLPLSRASSENFGFPVENLLIANTSLNIEKQITPLPYV